MTWGGQPVTDPDLNPIGNATLYTTCGPVNIDLLTWAHTFWQRIVDGDFDYLREARRIGNATYRIVNDNGVNMEQYIPSEGVFSSSFTSKWTADTLLTTWLKADSQHSSTIWWNGTYRKQDLNFYSYVYPLQFTRGEEPWARFYDRVGLTGTGWETTQRKEANDPFAYVVNRFFNVTTPRSQNATWPRHNFTVVGTEGLWNQQKWRWEYALNYRDATGVPRPLVPEIPWKPYSLVIERPAQQLVPVSEKGVLTVPIPVGFITLNLKDEDLARPVPYAVVQLDIFGRATSRTPPTLAVRHFGYKYKVGREGNLTLLYPTQEMMENILSFPTTTRPHVVNYTLTVYWYLNSSIVYKDAFNLTKRGYKVDKVAIADVTFVLAISADKERPVKDLYAVIFWFNVSTTGAYGRRRSLPRKDNSRRCKEDMDIHSRTRNPRSSQMDRRQTNTTMATNIREIHQIRLRPKVRQRNQQMDLQRCNTVMGHTLPVLRRRKGAPWMAVPAKANRLLQCTKHHTEHPHPVQSIRMERPATNRPIPSSVR
jgi:hypothetical protein